MKKHNVILTHLDTPIPLRNADGSQNAIGLITHEAQLHMTIGNYKEEICASVANTGKDVLILGIDWSKHHNPEIDWEKGQVHFTQCPQGCQSTPIVQAKPKSKGARREEAELNTLVEAIEMAGEPSVVEEEAEEEMVDGPEILEISGGRPQAACWAGGRQILGGQHIA